MSSFSSASPQQRRTLNEGRRSFREELSWRHNQFLMKEHQRHHQKLWQIRVANKGPDLRTCKTVQEPHFKSEQLVQRGYTRSNWERVSRQSRPHSDNAEKLSSSESPPSTKREFLAPLK